MQYIQIIYITNHSRCLRAHDTVALWALSRMRRLWCRFVDPVRRTGTIVLTALKKGSGVTLSAAHGRRQESEVGGEGGGKGQGTGGKGNRCDLIKC